MKKTVKIKIVGDIFLANLHINIGFGVGSQLHRGAGEEIVKSAAALLRNADFCAGNLESPLSFVDTQIVNKSCFGGAASFSHLLPSMGIDLVNVANNHIMENGEGGFQSTLRSLDEAGVLYVGISNDDRSNVQICNVNGMDIGWVGYSVIPDLSSNRLYAWGNQSVILDQVRNLRKHCDHVIVQIHWGDEFIRRPSWEQIQFAHAMIDSGAVLVIGHHAHVYQGYEAYQNGLIFYGLGNFIFDMHWLFDTRWAAVGSVVLDQHGIMSKMVDPFWINSNYCPVLPSSVVLKKIDQKIQETIHILREYQSGSLVEENYRESYQQDLARLTIQHKLLMRLYFVRNLYRLSPDTIRYFIRRRISKKA
jgi:poly-gamma-glutamate synthesis protein (capsule biosynthesis protein)